MLRVLYEIKGNRYRVPAPASPVLLFSCSMVAPSFLLCKYNYLSRQHDMSCFFSLRVSAQMQQGSEFRLLSPPTLTTFSQRGRWKYARCHTTMEILYLSGLRDMNIGQERLDPFGRIYKVRE